MNRIRQLRENNQITQEELAKKLDLSKGIISLYEKEERKPSLEVLLKLSEIFDCSIDYLLGKSDVRNIKQEEQTKQFLDNINFDINKYKPPTNEQKEQIKALIEVILKNNKKGENL